MFNDAWAEDVTRPDDPPTSPAPRVSPQELRLGLAMRGGVSLAVWIGGACAEIDFLRRSSLSVGSFYERCLDFAHYDRVSIDVLSGASAGGLNGVLMATSLVYGVGFDRMKTLWLDLADFERLLRDPDESSPTSLLKGDSYFLRELRKSLDRLIPPETAESGSFTDRVDLFLAATLMKPALVDIREGWSEPMQEQNQGALFHFRWRPGSVVSDFGLEGKERKATINKLAVAARSSSSFPGAFEPALIKSCRPPAPTFASARDKEDDFFGVFSQPEEKGVYVMDGGVLDNIPVARALDAIANVPAITATDRWLLFLHPSPEAQPKSESTDSDGGPGKVPGTMTTVFKSLGAKVSRESLLDDIKVLRAHNKKQPSYAIFREELLKRVLGDAVLQNPSKQAEITAAYIRYRGQRAEMESRAIATVLNDPAGALGHDPFPASLRNPLDGSDEGDLMVISQRFRSAFEATLPAEHGPALASLSSLGPPAIARWCRFLISAVRYLEERVSSSNAASNLGKKKFLLYGLREAVLALDDHMWVFICALSSLSTPSVRRTPAWAESAVEAREALVAAYYQETLPDNVLPDNPDTPRALAMMSRLRDEFRKVYDYYAGLPDVVSQLIEIATELGTIIRDESPSKPAEPDEDFTTGVIVRSLEAIDSEETNNEEISKLFLNLEILTYPVSLTLPMGWQYINFLRVAGSAKSPIEPFAGWSVEQKLAGNELMNFAAFYKRSWRANDWMWGRMDAAKTIIDLLVRPDRLRRPSESFDPSAFCYRVGQLVCSPPTLPDGWKEADGLLWKKFFETSWKNKCPNVLKELEAFANDPTCSALPRTKEVLTERRQWEILIHDLPDVVEAAAMDDLGKGIVSRTACQPTGGMRWLPKPRQVVAGIANRIREKRAYRTTRLREGSLTQAVEAIRISRDQDPLRVPEAMEQLIKSYRVGSETITGEVGSDQFTRVVANLSVVAWNALTTGKLGFVKALGVMLRALRLFALAIARRSKWATAAFLIIGAMSIYAFAANRQVVFFDRSVGTLVFSVLLVALFLYGLSALDRILIFSGFFIATIYYAWTVEGQVAISWGATAPRSFDIAWIIGVGAILIWTILSTWVFVDKRARFLASAFVIGLVGWFLIDPSVLPWPW